MTMWLIRAGKLGERESLALQQQIATVGWDDLPDLTPYRTRTQLGALLRSAYPDQKARTINNWHGQIWSVRDSMQVGDLAVLPLKSRPTVALGTVSGDYRYRTDLPCGPLHTRPVDWMAEVPRRAFDMDVLLSFGAFMTVCRIERNDAEDRVRAILAGPVETPSAAPTPALPSRTVPPPPDFEAMSYRLIRDRIAQRFKGHRMAELVAAVLQAQGYNVRISPPGADGGVDLLAGSGPLGFDAPRIVVQVKSQDTPLDVRPLRELAGVAERFHADRALLVGWGGFNQAVRAEAAADYFRTRLWDAGDLVAAIKDHYLRLPIAVRDAIPLKQVWALDDAAGVAA